MRVRVIPLEAGAGEAASEVVERKGQGHPDTLCDGLAEELSLALSRCYRERFGRILHHNVDKVLLVGGASRPAFGGGEVQEPIVVFLAGRATRSCEGVEVPVDELAVEGSRRWLSSRLHALDPARHVEIHPRIRAGASELVELFGRGGAAPLANDTSCGVGHAPLSRLEGLVLAVEAHLNAPDTKARHPELGEDVKVMGVREDGRIRLTVAVALVDRYLRHLDDYLAATAAAAALVAQSAQACGEGPIEVVVNAADDPARGSLYLTVTGTSAEAGDDGEAGRGNRVNGLITPGRPMTLESVAGKNPVTHVGKLYNLAASLAAQAVVEALPELAEAYCLLVSAIGRPVTDPQLAELRLRPRAGSPRGLAERAEALLRAQLETLPSLCDELLSGRLRLDRWPLRG